MKTEAEMINLAYRALKESKEKLSVAMLQLLDSTHFQVKTEYKSTSRWVAALPFSPTTFF